MSEANRPKKIEVTELILRDAHQSLMATRMAFEDMAPACADLDAAGFWSLECWGGATYDACIRFLNEDPWVRLREFKKLMPNTPLQMLLRGQNLLGYRHYGDDVVRRFCDKAAENGMDVFRIFDALNDLRNLEVAIEAVRGTGKHAQGCISYTVSPLHTVGAYVDQARRLKDMGVDSICIKDMAALIKPQAAYDLVRGIKQGCGEDTLVHLHVHATTGVTMVSLMKAVEAGADIVDTANPAMCLGPGHNPTDSFCEMLEGTAYTHGVDLARVRKVKKHFDAVRPRYAEFYTKFVGVSTSIFDSQIPGGMLSNMESQLKQQGAGDRMEEVLEEVPLVREAAGFPPLVTPSSQIVGTQAVLNVMMGRWKRLTGEFADLMLGYYGATIGDKDPDVVAIAARQTGKEPIQTRPADRIAPEWKELAAKAADLDGFNGSDEDVLTLAMFPQVAPGFFKERPQGPKNVGKDPAAAAPAATAPASVAAAASTVAPENAGPRPYTVTVEGRAYHVVVAPGHDGAPQVAQATPAPAPGAAPAAATSDPGGEPVKAELAGTVLRIEKNPGDSVQTDDIVLVLEAMKMEAAVLAPCAGKVASVAVAVGDSVVPGQVLAQIA
jgi:methylmalonyl-CoA carboxyltransferase 5S subunit